VTGETGMSATTKDDLRLRSFRGSISPPNPGVIVAVGFRNSQFRTMLELVTLHRTTYTKE
jgi:hypothetical protein